MCVITPLINFCNYIYNYTVDPPLTPLPTLKHIAIQYKHNKYIVCWCPYIYIYILYVCIYIYIYIYCDTCPEHSSTSPWKQRRNTCTQSSRAGRPQLYRIRGQLQKPQSHTHWGDMSPEDLPLTHSLFDFQRAVCDRPATRLEHSTDTQHLDTRTEDRGGSRSTIWPHHNMLALFTSPINTPSGAFIVLLWSCDSWARHNIYIYIYIYSAQSKWVHPLWKVKF